MTSDMSRDRELFPLNQCVNVKDRTVDGDNTVLIFRQGCK